MGEMGGRPVSMPGKNGGWHHDGWKDRVGITRSANMPLRKRKVVWEQKLID